MPGGRPRKEIDWNLFDRLCAIQCTQRELCDVLDIDDKTLTKLIKEKYNISFSELFEIKRGSGRASLRRMQWQAAEKGNATMLIWLGKQYLGQSDKQEVKQEHKADIDVALSKLTVDELKKLAKLDADKSE